MYDTSIVEVRRMMRILYIKIRTMVCLLRIRIIFYTTVILMHLSNVLYMTWYVTQSHYKDEKALIFKDLEYRFFTTWNFVLQVVYSLLGLACDTLLLKNSRKKNYQLPEAMSDFREVVYSGLVWPSSLVVFSVFWSVYAFDRGLIYPEFLDTVIPPISNHVIHTVIFPVALFELVFRPRFEPETHARNVAQLCLHLSVYVCVLFFTFQERGIWLYPIFKQLYGTVYFPLALGCVGFLFFIFYYSQWPLTKMIHGSKNKQPKKTQADKKKKNK
ncbi:unnamed protein product [Arctia plantaginis]|uniref:Androgen-dependent TFPI-regulating protein n=1 Tax=Arctia plantaginis TaxID=874455 RepID=A0A8S1BTU8_ARCPL|nr:unnamed protein product [Arctia plantaginis]